MHTHVFVSGGHWTFVPGGGPVPVSVDVVVGGGVGGGVVVVGGGVGGEVGGEVGGGVGGGVGEGPKGFEYAVLFHT